MPLLPFLQLYLSWPRLLQPFLAHQVRAEAVTVEVGQAAEAPALYRVVEAVMVAAQAVAVPDLDRVAVI